jgi:ubiquinone/menaquinone biosynthesis C-methylase UbiE
MARGIVLEIGAGSGANFPYYDRNHVERLYALEPNPGMLRLAEGQRRRTGLKIEFLRTDRIPLADRSVNTVVSTFTRCTVPSLEDMLEGITRVLKPAGLLIFVENSLATDGRVQRWQRCWEPIHRRVFHGPRLTRDIPSSIAGAGFHLEHVDRNYLSQSPKSWTYCAWGTAKSLWPASRV